MTVRERGNILPLVAVGTVAFLLLVIPTLLVQRKQSSRMATVEAQVSIGDGSGGAAPIADGPHYRWPDSEVPRTAERLRDATAVTIAAITTVVEGEMIGAPRRNVDEIVFAMTYHKLIPSEWSTQESGVLQTAHGSIHLRYAPRTSTVEVLAVPDDRADGPALLIRIPDAENTMIGARYFQSKQLDGIVYPRPFAPLAEVISAGWQPQLFKQAQIPDAQRADLEEWGRTISPK